MEVYVMLQYSQFWNFKMLSFFFTFFEDFWNKCLFSVFLIIFAFLHNLIMNTNIGHEPNPDVF